MYTYQCPKCPMRYERRSANGAALAGRMHTVVSHNGAPTVAERPATPCIGPLCNEPCPAERPWCSALLGAGGFSSAEAIRDAIKTNMAAS